MYSYTEENYLKAIYKLQEQSGEAINTNSIAGAMATKAASVTDMIKKLSDKKLLKYQKYKGVHLTDAGKKIAIETVRKHRLWETFLHHKLNFLWDEVHDVAEQLEHIQSEALIDKLDEYLGFPSHDPHGDPIPGRNGIIKVTKLLLLSDLETGKHGIISGVVNHSRLFLQYLQKNGLTLGRSIKILEINAFDLSVQIELDKVKKIHISNEVARNILIKTK
ncbi:MAG: metal-dependent transcriptional regulator [Bacteroidota bacterium]|nr:metal-dependent transcriptional regulator [Bacteroidota bacterium]